MVGPMGSGKTTLALKLSKDRGAQFYSLDKTIREFGLPVRNVQDYETHMAKALEIIASHSIQALKGGTPVVLDFGGGMGHWNWLKDIADSTGANIEIYHFEVPLEMRLERVRKRNEEKPADVYQFTMTDKEVVASKPTRETPLPSERVKIIKIT
jgi:predicted kinase